MHRPLSPSDRVAAGWSPRISQGLDALVEHATNGFYGKKGEMPARGGNDALSDEQARSAVRFMVSRVDPVAGAQ